MKKILLTAISLTTAAGAFAQGVVNFNNRLSGTSHVYAPLGPGDTTRIQGVGSNDGFPAGSTDFGGRLPIGANGTGGQYGAATTFSQLLGAPGSNAPESTLLPALGAASTFRTGLAAGAVAGSLATFNNILPDAPVGSFEMVAWDNSSGLYPTWNEGSVAWKAGLIAAGASTEFNVQHISGGILNTPPVLFPGLVSFNLYFVPEPATAALLGLGAAAMLICRRRK